MRRFSLRPLLLCVVCAAMSACATQGSGPHQATGNNPPTATMTTTTPLVDAGLDYSAFVARLRAVGATVVANGDVTQPFFAVPGHILSVNGGRVEVHEYATAADLASDTANISPDGVDIGSTRVDWIAPPHFYKDGRVLAIYLGTDSSIIHLLETILGPQFAGQVGP